MRTGRGATRMGAFSLNARVMMRYFYNGVKTRVNCVVKVMLRRDEMESNQPPAPLPCPQVANSRALQLSLNI